MRRPLAHQRGTPRHVAGDAAPAPDPRRHPAPPVGLLPVPRRCSGTSRALDTSPMRCATWPARSVRHETSTSCCPARRPTCSRPDSSPRSPRPGRRPTTGCWPCSPPPSGALRRMPSTTFSRAPRGTSRRTRPSSTSPGRALDRRWHRVVASHPLLASMSAEGASPGPHRGQEAPLRLRVLRLPVCRRRPVGGDRRRRGAHRGRPPTPGTSSRCSRPSARSTTTPRPTGCSGRSAPLPRRSTSHASWRREWMPWAGWPPSTPSGAERR